TDSYDQLDDRLVCTDPAELPEVRSYSCDGINGERAFTDDAVRTTVRQLMDENTWISAAFAVEGIDPEALTYNTLHRSASMLTLDADRTQALRHLARTAGTTLHAPVLTAYYRALTTLTGRRDLVLGLAVTGRDESTGDAHRVFGPFAEAVALRPVPPSDDADPAPGFDEDLRRVTAETIAARTAGPLDLRTPQGLPRTAQFFFTFLDFSSLGAPPDTTLSLRADDSDTELAPPPVGTDVFLAVRPTPDGKGLSITARASSRAVTCDELMRFAGELRGELEGEGSRHRDTRLDAALVGYLPTPHQLAAFAGLPAHAVPSREQLRALLFPDGRPRVPPTSALSTILPCRRKPCRCTHMS
ncbi:condensation domain-containing protein, partial [Streptomyces sp. MB09-02B]|uniref:condensation domain-containing protein n=1 Tax=Streptomyces sp. MB09-02B TaxID=3028667 RepID=UPI0029B88103